MTNTLTRFAPSPNGLLHLGHVYAAQQVWRMAAVLGAEVLLRIEDTDFTRCKPEFENAIVEDLAWLGFQWAGEVVRQSDRKPLYEAAINQLKAMDLLYPCACTRKDIEASWGGEPQFGPEGMRYRGTCKGKVLDDAQPVAWRLDMSLALGRIDSLTVNTVEDGILDFRPLAEETGDVVLVRKDIGSSYHLAVTVDDANQGISHVIRGEDMRDATAVHRVLQSLLGLPVPIYHFHPLLKERDGRKLAKRDGAEGVRVLKEQGLSPAEILAQASAHWSLS
ncbi:MAG: tRNA glutamyl-Q(34) synthetase GluQRS [Alphaproteobacteria bacterium]